MNTNNKIEIVIEQVDSILSDIEHREKLDTIGARYSELKSYIQNEIKSRGNTTATEYDETTYYPALDEFSVLLKKKKGSSDYGKIYDSLLDAVGILKWYVSQDSEI